MGQFPPSLLTVEVLREVATIVMLISVALLAASKARERCAVFLWTFALWDVSYYAALWATIRWPTSLADFDVLFLIPVQWIAQVWFPLLVSALTLLAVGLSRRASGIGFQPQRCDGKNSHLLASRGPATGFGALLAIPVGISLV